MNLLEITRRIAESRRDITDRAHTEGHTAWQYEICGLPEYALKARNITFLMRTYGTIEEKIAFIQGYSDAQREWIALNQYNLAFDAKHANDPVDGMLLIDGVWHEVSR